MRHLLRVSIFVLFAASAALAQRTDLSGLKFCIDPGHGGHNPANDRHVIPDPGTDFWESESNFQKALLLKSLLEARGASVILTRNTNDYPYDPATGDPTEPSLTARWTLANSNNVDWFHSIHSNATVGNNTSTNYTMVLLKENIATRSAAFPAAIDMSSYIYSNIRAKNRTSPSGGNISGKAGVYLDYTFYGGPNGGFNLGVLKGLLMPGELSEGSFHDYYPETRRLMNNYYRKMEAYGILNAFLQYYGVPSDTLCIVAGIQTDSDNGKPVNATLLRVMPEDRVYAGDAYNNGYYMFDSLSSGAHKIIFETAGYSDDTIDVALAEGQVLFLDRALETPTPPRVISAVPSNNSVNVSALSGVEISFTKVMDTATVRSAFSIDPVLDGGLSWKNGNKTLAFKPASHFAHLTEYHITLGGTAASATGFSLDGNGDSTGGDPYTLTFTTEAPVPPYITMSRPAGNDTSFSVTGLLGVRFSKSMDTNSVIASFSLTPSVKGTVSFGTNNTTFTFTPANPLPYATDFTMRLEGTASSMDDVLLDGNKDGTAGGAFAVDFRTQENPLYVDDGGGNVPKKFALAQNYPNPFNPTTAIHYQIAAVSNVTLKFYDVLGREVATLVNGRQAPGRYSATFDAAGLTSGVYICRLVAGQNSAHIKLILLK